MVLYLHVHLCLQIEFTSSAFAGDRMLYLGTSVGVITVWDTRTNSCVLHWQADRHEISRYPCVILYKNLYLSS